MSAGKDMASVESLAREVAEGMGLRLYEVRMLSQRGRSVLRVTVDKEGGHVPGQGVTVHECAQVSRELGALLDAEEPIAHAYDLEVSSPGVERPLRAPQHFIWAVGERVAVWTYPESGYPAEMEGVLLSYQEDTQVLAVRVAPTQKKKKGQKASPVPESEWQTLEVPLTAVTKARTRYDFSV